MNKRRIHLKNFASRPILRLLTLVCFFHFSGLNNGLTYFAAPGEAPARVDFAPILLKKTVRIFSPLAWRRALSEGRGFGWFSRSGRMLEIASQRAIRNMFAESYVLQSTMKSVWSNLYRSQDGRERLSPPQGSPALPVSALAPAGENSRVVQPVGRLVAEDPRYLDKTRRESWLKAEKFTDPRLDGESPELTPAWMAGVWVPIRTEGAVKNLGSSLQRARPLHRRIVFATGDGQADAEPSSPEIARGAAAVT